MDGPAWAVCAGAMHMFLLALTGTLACRQGMLTSEGKRVLAGAAYYVFSPALIFVTLASTVSARTLLLCWPLLVNVLVVTLLGACLGMGMAFLTRADPACRGHLVLSSALGNVFTLPLVLLCSLATGGEGLLPSWPAEKAGNVAASYVSISLLVALPLNAVLGHFLLKHACDPDPETGVETDSLVKSNSDLEPPTPGSTTDEGVGLLHAVGPVATSAAKDGTEPRPGTGPQLSADCAPQHTVTTIGVVRVSSGQVDADSVRVAQAQGSVAGQPILSEHPGVQGGHQTQAWSAAGGTVTADHGERTDTGVVGNTGVITATGGAEGTCQDPALFKHAEPGYLALGAPSPHVRWADSATGTSAVPTAGADGVDRSIPSVHASTHPAASEITVSSSATEDAELPSSFQPDAIRPSPAPPPLEVDLPPMYSPPSFLSPAWSGTDGTGRSVTATRGMLRVPSQKGPHESWYAGFSLERWRRERGRHRQAEGVYLPVELHDGMAWAPWVSHPALRDTPPALPRSLSLGQRLLSLSSSMSRAAQRSFSRLRDARDQVLGGSAPAQWHAGLAGAVFQEMVSPMYMSCVLSVIVGCIEPLKRALFEPEAPLHVVADSLRTLADCCIPSLMLVLGSTLAYGPGSLSVPVKAILGVGITRLVVLPLINALLVLSALRWNWFTSPDPLFTLTLLFQGCVPSAMAVHTLTTRYQGDSALVSAILFWTYLAGAVTMTGFGVWFLHLAAA